MSNNPQSDDKRLLELLERWQSGDFSRADEQELQALADSDAFRRETVEGFWAFSETDHTVYLDAVRARLRRKSKHAIQVPMPRVLTAIAAIGLLILAVVWLIPGNQEPGSMAQESLPRPVEEQPIASNFPAEQPATEAVRVQERPSKAAVDKIAPGKQAPAVYGNSSASSAAPEAEVAPTPLSKEEDVVDEISAAKPIENESNYSKAPTGQVKLDPFLGKAAAPARSQDQESAGAKEAMKKKAPMASGGTQPAGGWAVFQDYLRNNARLPEAARQNNITGTVRLKFSLDKQNRPKDFITLRSLGFGCDEEAIRLVKAYSWQRGKERSVTVDVPFVR